MTLNGSSTNGHSNGSVANGKTPTAEELAVNANLPTEVPKLLDDVASLGKDYLGANPDARLTLLEAARSLVYALETPREAIIRHCWSESTGYAALETAVALNLFTALDANDTPKTVAELALATGSDPALLGRLMKHIAAMGVITETGRDEYRSTGFSKVLTVEKYSDAFPLMTSRFTKGILALPEFLEKTNYQNPTSATDTAFQLGYNTKMGFFGHVQQEPVTARRFNNHMGVYAQGRKRWMDPGFYLVQEQLIEGTQISKDDVLLVDVGGSFGHDLLDFRRKWPDVPGRLVLQDLPEVVSSVKDKYPDIEVMGHNFFTEQPIKGARAYYMHSVLHDWPDSNCEKILANIVAAMKPGYSKLLVNENVIPDTGAYWETTSLDLIMMQIGSGERTERQWHSLLESAGLKITKIWTAQRGVESLIECELA
ncbi:S-adenosyl-L-methionine-dependent methyltransferase [Aspergillus undulatus]|uniref:S-adenosyl-L-methionine-dependent methyltransferase n=1 Tax=Aspergillus undulatus TaxID=1810928 RepID=UPI003CCCF7B7